MKTLLLTSALGLVLASPAFAQNTAPYPSPVSVVSGFQGMGDKAASGVVAHWGVIAFSSRNPTAQLAQICQDDGATGCTNISAVNGVLSSTQTGPYGGTACDTSTHKCLGKTAYDDSGANNCSGPCNVTTSVAVLMPLFVPNANGTVPAFQCNGSSVLDSPTFTAVGPTMTVAFSISVPSDPVSNARMVGTAGTALYGMGGGVVTFAYQGSIVDSAAQSTNTFYAVIGDSDGSGNGRNVTNGTVVTGAIGTNTSGTGVSLCGDNPTTPSILGSFMEVGIYGIQFTPTQETNVTSVMRANGGGF